MIIHYEAVRKMWDSKIYW